MFFFSIKQKNTSNSSNSSNNYKNNNNLSKTSPGCPCLTQSTASPPATQYSDATLPQLTSDLNSSRATELRTLRTDFSLVMVTATCVVEGRKECKFEILGVFN